MSEQNKYSGLPYKETTFFALFKKSKSEPFGFPFVVTLVISIILGLYLYLTKDASFLNIVLSKSETIFSIAVSSLGLVLAALALVLVIFNKKTMHHATASGAFQYFLFPYYVAAVSWTTLSIISFLYIILEDTLLITNFEFIKKVIGFLLISLTLYSIFYTIRLVGSIISNTLLSASDEYETNEDGK